MSLQPEQQVEPQAMGIRIVADPLDRGLAGREGVRHSTLGGQQAGPVGMVAGQDEVVRPLEPDRLFQVGEGLRRRAGVGSLLSRTTSARPRYKGAQSGHRSIARRNWSMASSYRPCWQ